MANFLYRRGDEQRECGCKDASLGAKEDIHTATDGGSRTFAIDRKTRSLAQAGPPTPSNH